MISTTLSGHFRLNVEMASRFRRRKTIYFDVEIAVEMSTSNQKCPHTINTISKYVVVPMIGVRFYDELSFRHYLQHYSGITRATEIKLCVCVHRQVCCDKISSIAVKSHKTRCQNNPKDLSYIPKTYPEVVQDFRKSFLGFGNKSLL